MDSATQTGVSLLRPIPGARGESRVRDLQALGLAIAGVNIHLLPLLRAQGSIDQVRSRILNGGWRHIKTPMSLSIIGLLMSTDRRALMTMSLPPVASGSACLSAASKAQGWQRQYVEPYFERGRGAGRCDREQIEAPRRKPLKRRS